MSYNFSANQYEGTFNSKRLGNWEVPRRHPARPRARTGSTHPIVDNKGHLLPGLRRPGDALWGKGPFTAWEHPKRITRAYVLRTFSVWAAALQESLLSFELGGTNIISAEQMDAEASKRLETWLKRSAHVPLPQQEVSVTPLLPIEPPQNNEQKISRKSDSKRRNSASSSRSSKTELSQLSRRSLKNLENIESPKARDTRRSSAVSSGKAPPLQAPESLSEIPRSQPASSRRSSASNRPHTAPAPSVISNLPTQLGPPLGTGYSAFQVARTLAEESHSHQPLPDTVHDPLFCALQARRERDPGLALPSPHHASPKTAATPARPASSALPPRRITEMDLAIRWDLRLPGEKRPNAPDSRVAPAVFNVVPPTGDCGLPGGCNTPRGATPPPPVPRTAWSEPNERYPAHKRATSSKIEDKRQANAKSNEPYSEKRNVDETTEKPPRRSRSTPNLSRRPCAACDQDKPPTAPPQRGPANSYFKQAFKAGRPNNMRPFTSVPKPQLLVPQPRKPFTKRSYSIATLAPPFSLWPDGSRAQDYPDHWRLASVYQHAYKPPQLRRKPLLASVFQ